MIIALGSIIFLSFLGIGFLFFKRAGGFNEVKYLKEEKSKQAEKILQLTSENARLEAEKKSY